ncbi:MAG: helix-turn-helix transcriptional regulator [Desulfovibrio sp.]|nr:helix-turn-helix transcriptional regulator [Desulfovibrio sp.]
MNFPKELGERVKELRKQAGLTQEQAAEGAGISGKYLGEVERGEVNVSVAILSKLAEVFGIDISDFFRSQHLRPISEIKKEMKSFIDNDKDEDVRLLYRIFTAVFR